MTVHKTLMIYFRAWYLRWCEPTRVPRIFYHECWRYSRNSCSRCSCRRRHCCSRAVLGVCIQTQDGRKGSCPGPLNVIFTAMLVNNDLSKLKYLGKSENSSYIDTGSVHVIILKFSFNEFRKNTKCILLHEPLAILQCFYI